MFNDQEILSRILETIKKRGITEKECLSGSGVNSSYFSDWKNGRIKSPSLEKIVQIADFLKVSLDYVVSGIEPKEEPNDQSDISNFAMMYQSLDDRGQATVKVALYNELDRMQHNGSEFSPGFSLCDQNEKKLG